MNPEQPWGAQPPAAPQEPRRPRWSGRKTVAALAIAVTIAAGGGAVIYAATNDDSGTTQGGPGGRGPGPDGMGPRIIGGPLTDALHGEFVVADGSTRLLQTGEVTSISSGSISVTSDDGHAATYTINSSTEQAGDIQTGDEVTVIAKKTDTTAISVFELSAMPGGGPGQGQPPRRGNNP